MDPRGNISPPLQIKYCIVNFIYSQWCRVGELAAQPNLAVMNAKSAREYSAKIGVRLLQYLLILLATSFDFVFGKKLAVICK